MDQSKTKNQTEYFDLCKKELLAKLEECDNVEDREILHLIDEILYQKGPAMQIGLQQKERLRRELFCSVRRLDILQDLLEDEEVTEIMVNGFRDIFYEKEGRIFRWEKSFAEEKRLDDLIQQIVGSCNRSVNEQSPIVDARLKNGDRVNVVMPPVSLGGPILTIRRFPKDPVSMEKLIAWGSITREAASFLERCVAAGYSILVSGGTSTGKTTFLNALSGYIPKKERIVTIEDNAELQIRGIENLVRLESRNSNLEGGSEITLRDLIKTALRMRPNRIIIGEVRGAEAADFLVCLNTGHSGSLGSVHANSASDVISRLEMMVRMGMDLPIPVIRSQISSGVELIVHLNREADGKRSVAEIAELCGFDGENIRMQSLFLKNKKGVLEKKNSLLASEKLEKIIRQNSQKH